ncbi:MAG: PhzF family phenazine biosynthesis protein [Deltaproteobacteria bacterium]|nr:PhzF family phenazine biosynthesis protein [Deltaproteobacteria bacterium]
MLRFRIVNVFAIEGAPLSGNPLCVFEDGDGLDDATMQALALQLNLSETTFLTAPGATGASAGVRIFTPSYEMPFAGHPTLGSAHVLRALGRAGDRLTLAMKAGVIPVSAVGDVWTLVANPPRAGRPAAARADLAAMLGLAEADVGATPRWVDTGSEQLIIPLTSVDAVRRAVCDPSLLLRHGALRPERCLAQIFAPRDDGELEVRFFFLKGNSVVEDPATGSACANLGGWYLLEGAALPLRRVLHQGAAVGRPSRLELEVGGDGVIRVSGRVIALATGEMPEFGPAAPPA